MSATQTQTVVRASRPGSPGGPGGPGGPDGVPHQPADQTNGPDYSKVPNVSPKGPELVPSPEWARYRLYKLRTDISDVFPEYFPDVRKQILEGLNAEERAGHPQNTHPPRFTKRSLEDLKYDYTPKQLDFLNLKAVYNEVDHANARLSRRQRLDADGEGDRIPSLWFERMSQDLFVRVWEFCSDTFGQGADGGLGDHDWTHRWLDKLPGEFVVLASQVARGDRTVAEAKSYDPNNWELMFVDSMSRVKLLVGVMAKLLEKNVFNCLLFGATDDEKTALEADDRARDFLDDSYQRNKTRSGTARDYISGSVAQTTRGGGLEGLWTDSFWPEVDSVTMGILDLLLPLINLVGEDLPPKPWPPLKEIHQRLHDIVAEAAWFTNGMRATRSVFWIQFPLPGELNDISHEHVIDDIWERSKKKAVAHDTAAKRRYDGEMQASWARDHPGADMTPEYKAQYESDNPRDHALRRTAKVQVAMWPFIKRFTPVGEMDAGDGPFNSGETITQIMKAQCVYYYGDDLDAADMDERLTLSEHIKSRRWKRWFTLRAFLIYALLALSLLLFISPDVARQSDDQTSSIKPSTGGQGSLGSKTAMTIVVPIQSEIVTQTAIIPEPEERGDDEIEQQSEDGHYGNQPNTPKSAVKSITSKIASGVDKVYEKASSGKDKAVEGEDKVAEVIGAGVDMVSEMISADPELLTQITQQVLSEIAEESIRSSVSKQRSIDRAQSEKASISQRVVNEEARRLAGDKSHPDEYTSNPNRKPSDGSARTTSISGRRSGGQEEVKDEITAAAAAAEPTEDAEDSMAEKVRRRLSARLAELAYQKASEKAKGEGSTPKATGAGRITSPSARYEKHGGGGENVARTGDADTTTVEAIVESPVVIVVDKKTGKVVERIPHPVVITDKKTTTKGGMRIGKKTITITVPQDKVVVTVKGPVDQPVVQGSTLKTAFGTAGYGGNIFTQVWQWIFESLYTLGRIWGCIRSVVTRDIGDHPLLSLLVVIITLLSMRLLFDGRLLAQAPAWLRGLLR